MQKPSNVTVLIALLALALAIACDKSPTGPNGPTGGNSIARLEMSGPDTIAPGTQVQYTLKAFLSDGTARDETRGVTWTSLNTTVATVDPLGRVSAIKMGDTTIRASSGGSSSTKNIVVTPVGTFRVQGRVVDEGSSTVVRSADVTIRAADGFEVRTSPNAAGDFVFYGVPSEAELEVSSTDYIKHTQALHLTAHTALNIRLRPIALPIELGGTYRLTVTAGACVSNANRPQLAPSLRSRTYDAVMTQRGTDIQVALSNAEFFSKDGRMQNSFFGYIRSGRLSFYLYGPDNYYYDYYLPFYVSEVIERLPDGTFLITSGGGPVVVRDGGLRATISGGLWHRATIPNGTVLGVCSTDVSLDFTK